MEHPKGVDMSQYQGTKVNGQLRFVPPRLGFTPDFGIVKFTEVFIDSTGKTNHWANPLAADQVKWLRSIGALVGGYWYEHPDNVAPQEGQVEWYLQHARPLLNHPSDFHVVDWEAPGITSLMKDRALDRLAYMEPHKRVMLYCDIDYWTHVDKSGKCGDGLYLADPSHAIGHPGVQHPVMIQQAGLTDGYDTDYGIGWPSKAAMSTWLLGKVPVPVPPKPVAPKPVVAPPIPQPIWGSFWQTIANWFRGL